MTVRLHIERLVVEGFDLEPGSGQLIADGLRAELERLLLDPAQPLEELGSVHLAKRMATFHSGRAATASRVAEGTARALATEIVKCSS